VCAAAPEQAPSRQLRLCPAGTQMLTRCAVQHGALTLRMQIEAGVASLKIEGKSVTLQQYFKYYKDAGLKIIAPGQRSHTLLLGCSAQTTAAPLVRCASAPSLRRANFAMHASQCSDSAVHMLLLLATPTVTITSSYTCLTVRTGSMSLLLSALHYTSHSIPSTCHSPEWPEWQGSTITVRYRSQGCWTRHHHM
jgi:hypothetical protein